MLRGKSFEGPESRGEIRASVGVGKHELKTTVRIEHPRLWWPWDLGRPDLYEAEVRIEEGDRVHDRSRTSFGIRHVEMAWNPGFTRDEVSFPRTVRINDKTHFIRSAAWGGPPDIFVGRTSPDEYRKLVRLAREANLNNQAAVLPVPLRALGPEIERFFLSLKEEWLRRILVPLDRDAMQRELACYAAWFERWRSHQGLSGRTPRDVFEGRPTVEKTRPTVSEMPRSEREAPPACTHECRREV